MDVVEIDTNDNDTLFRIQTEFAHLIEENERLKKRSLYLSLKLQYVEKERDLMQQKVQHFRDMANIDLDLLTLSLDYNKNTESRTELDKVFALIHAIMEEEEIHWLKQEKQIDDHIDFDREECSIPHLYLGSQNPLSNQGEEISKCTSVKKCGNCHLCKTVPNNNNNNNNKIKDEHVRVISVLCDLQNPSRLLHQPAHSSLSEDVKYDDDIWDMEMCDSEDTTLRSNGLSTSEGSIHHHHSKQESTGDLSSTLSLTNSPCHDYDFQEEPGSFSVIPNLEEENSVDVEIDTEDDHRKSLGTEDDRCSQNPPILQNGVSEINDQQTVQNIVTPAHQKNFPNLIKDNVSLPTPLPHRMKLGKNCELKSGPPTPEEVKKRIERIIKENVNILSSQLSSWDVSSSYDQDLDLQCYLHPTAHSSTGQEMLEVLVSPPVKASVCVEMSESPTEQNSIAKVVSETGRKSIVRQGYSYRLDRVLASGKQSWRCVHSYCKGRIYVSEENDHILTRVHCHLPMSVTNNEPIAEI